MLCPEHARKSSGLGLRDALVQDRSAAVAALAPTSAPRGVEPYDLVQVVGHALRVPHESERPHELVASDGVGEGDPRRIRLAPPQGSSLSTLQSAKPAR